MNLLWKLNDKGTHVKFCWIPSHCGIEGNEAADKLAKKSLGLNIDALLGIYHADLKPQVNAYVQQLTQVKWDVEVHGRDLYLLKANLAPPDRYKHLKRAEEVAMTRLRIGHCKATKGHIVSRGPPAVCHHCGSTLSREHILLECGTVQELRGEFYEADSLTSLFECVRPLAIIGGRWWEAFKRDVPGGDISWRSLPGGHPASQIGVGSSWEDSDPRSPEPLVVRGGWLWLIWVVRWTT